MSQSTDDLKKYIAELEERLAKINWILDDDTVLDKVRQIKEVMRK